MSPETFSSISVKLDTYYKLLESFKMEIETVDRQIRAVLTEGDKTCDLLARHDALIDSIRDIRGEIEAAERIKSFLPVPYAR